MVRGVRLALTLALAWAWTTSASVLVPTYVMPPDSFVRDQRSLADQNTASSQRTLKRLVGGHMKIRNDREYGDPTKNSFAFDEKSEGKFAGVIISKGQNTVGPNQGVWDDGMLMSSAGDGKESAKKGKDDDEDKKTLSDQVAEGKYGLIQNEIFKKMPERPGVVSYEPNSDTRDKDNVHTLGGLKKDEIWLAEDHLLVLRGGSFPERTEESDRPWPAIDSYEAPRRQVKLPHKPKVPPPFPVRPSDNGPLVFLTPNGSVPASLFPQFITGEGFSPLPPSDFPFPPNPSYTPSDNQGNITSGGPPFANAPFPVFPGNFSEGAFPPFPFPHPMNGSFPEGYPPGAAFLPPPGNQTDLYDEDDPSIYYPPPYNFSYPVENASVPAGPLVPGIVLPPPPDFFSWVEDGRTTSTEGSTSTIPVTTAGMIRSKYKRPPSYIQRKPQKQRPTYKPTENSLKTEISTTTLQPEIIEVTTVKPVPVQVIQIPKPSPVRVQSYSVNTPATKQKSERPVYRNKSKLTTKAPLTIVYDYPEGNYEKNPETTAKPFALYGLPEKTPAVLTNSIVTSTPVPLRAYYASIPQDIPSTKLEPIYTPKQNENSVASFYFYDEQPTTKKPDPYFDGRHYYETVNPVSPPNEFQPRPQTGFSPLVDVTYGSLDQADSLLLWPQKQGPRTLTQEYFSVQKPRPQPVYLQPNRPDPFYQQLAEIQQTIDYFSTNRPKPYPQRQNGRYKQKAATPKPVYQFSFQSNQEPKQTRQQYVSFRAPKLDTEPFRPMVSYSKPFNTENEFNAITPSMQPYHQQYLIENVKVTTETPTSSKYYPKNNPKSEEYDEQPTQKEKFNKKVKPARTHETKESQPKEMLNSFPSTTAAPQSHAYYTQQDERYFDAITKNYFDIFGKKIEDTNRDNSGIAVTPPIGTVRTPIDNGIDLVYAPETSEHRKPPSLASDTLVNHRPPLPQIEPESEFIPIPNPAYREQYQQIQQVPTYTAEQLDLIKADRPVNDDVRNYLRPQQRPNYRRPWDPNAEINYAPPSLQHDTRVNWVNQGRPPINADAEFIQPINTAGEGRPGSFVSYRLPGDGAHVYFLTPQAAQAVQERYNYRAPGHR